MEWLFQLINIKFRFSHHISESLPKHRYDFYYKMLRQVVKKRYLAQKCIPEQNPHMKCRFSLHTSELISFSMYKGRKFLKKLWCCVGGGYKVIWLYQLSWKCKLATVTGWKADVSSISPSSEWMEELWVVCGFIWRKWSYTIGGNIATRKTWIN